ncbi:HelD family protein [Clostridium fallax]|uniref:DNA helicase-2 / ATP-dependent DNA helicase PcrA n=1 Tax=Clostridium fallax TaxID=1533 RepID=A0A1M4XQF3_9CLOT|nr:UvrD-helicase domain-containing protein [Clostridium fallax]SHE95586.1 DNA helicase-2 / ATP-dependent DNA helicase PcrA [Clostridium fallax]SQB08087.1 helicase [Clostridium fallax]
MNLDNSKEVELLVEERKLEDTLNILNDEILNYISKRKHIINYILEYRKNFVDEYKDDEDLLIEYFDHEKYVKEEAFKTIDRRLKELTVLKDSPYFGRITFTEDDEETVDNLYIGRFGVTPEGTFDPLIVDWRAPVASLFYNGNIGKASYKAPAGEIDVDILGRRQYIIKKGQLKGMFDSALDIKDDILQMVLSENSNEKLKDIITTLQKEQDEIIRKDKNTTVIVNGVAGSGKTTVALHRVAYLLYNYRKQLENRVLILGPNTIFIEYISQVLPSLGEVGVKQQTFLNFALEEIDEDINVMDFGEYMEKILSGDQNFIKKVKRKRSEDYIKELDKYIDEMNEDYFKFEPIKYFSEEIISLKEIEELFNKYYGYMPLFKRSEKIKRVLISKIKDKRDEKVRELKKEIEEYKKSLTKDQLLIESNDIEFRKRLKIREIVREVINSREDLERWIKRENIIRLYNSKFNDNEELTIDDLAPILYMMIKLEDKKSKDQIKHVVIDEGQDYTLLQFKIIKELTGANSFTIVGDKNQRFISGDSNPAMISLNNILFNKTDIYELNKSYRSTYEIMDFANKYLKDDKIVPLVRKGKDVEVVKVRERDDFIKSINEKIHDFKEDGLESIAVITRNIEDIEKIYKELREKNNIIKFSNENIIYNGGLVIIPSYYAKGLEFDGVIIADINSEEEKNHYEEDLVNYIMATRALHRLAVIKE